MGQSELILAWKTLLSTITKGITATLYKTYLLILLLIHTPLYGFLGIDVLSSLTSADRIPMHTPRIGSDEVQKLMGLLARATENQDGACGDAWVVRGLVALVSIRISTQKADAEVVR